MTFRNLKNSMILILVIISGAIYAQKKETVTITGKITVKDTGKPPIGIITIAEKGVADYWADGDNIGTNRHTFVEKDGSYKFTINKGGTIVIQDGFNRYMPTTIRNINENQTKDLFFRLSKRTNPPAYPANELTDFEKKIDIHKRIKISGKITDPSGKPIGNATIAQFDVYGERVPGNIAHTTSAKDGKYEYTVLKGGRIAIVSQGFEMKQFTATKDTVINVKMMRVNPFK
ncbi:peptidase associated/transthyretin-like domain-containing protein [Myroides guanonis]|uniref:Carboxypeptidase regulatory-like domain-containing protein n=1 Tax=Myroides guanonis TaxID=1150112 RepID=A0A1I3PEM0_9FLAO|nr:hypothetical protein [Myroides guanonis]SFJ19923.1 Carboxypeptidase regulatory-like domain-containing protein [Myroides guanonis]